MAILGSHYCSPYHGDHRRQVRSEINKVNIRHLIKIILNWVCMEQSCQTFFFGRAVL